MQDIEKETKTLIYGNTMQVNEHIKASSQTINDLQKN